MEGHNLNPLDFKSDQEVRWCPGCGDTLVLNSVQKALSELGRTREEVVFVSGIGCSSRFPYYVNTYGFHGIHGRGSAIATGVKLANPNLSVWQITGDGDALAIGGNHFIHAIRRNIDINIILLNNEIYGLTKGQYSPTSKIGTISKSSPFGTIEHPFSPGELIIGAQGKFFARTVDNNIKLTTDVLVEAARFDGASLVEVLQNCVIFNDAIHDYAENKELRDDHTIILKHGEKMIFGKNKDKGLIFDTDKRLKVVKIGENGITEEDILIHDAHNNDILGLHYRLASMRPPQFPIALGVIRSIQTTTYEDLLIEQIDKVKEKSNIKTIDDLLNSGNTWEVK